jgi:hypothetical protein
MNGDRLDSVAKSIASPTRRGVFLVGGIALCGLAGFLERSRAKPGPGDRKRTRQRKRKRERRRDRRRSALYPDLEALLPDRLEFFRLGNGTYVLRFTSTVWNSGEGPLEIEAPTSPQTGESGQLFQNLYDAAVGGARVSRRRVNGRISYHATHSHFHFNDFASYQLLRREEASRVYGPIGEGTKTSFCIIDSVLVTGSLEPEYDRCERTRQGLSPGRGDTYAYNLPEQWVEIGPEPLADGAYALQVTADPRNLLAEGGGERERNNTATGYFTVSSGAIGPVSVVPPSE